MGLDIRAFERVTLTKSHPVTDSCWDEEHILIHDPPDFPNSLGGLVPGRCYRPVGKQLGFRAGSYSGYNAWRSLLCVFALGVEPKEVWNAPKRFEGKPFTLLINFSDCEGEIGPKACAILARDFAESRERVRPRLESAHPGWADVKYDDWQAAFELAADHGLVCFR